LSFAACVLRMPRAAPVRLPSQPTRRARVAPENASGHSRSFIRARQLRNGTRRPRRGRRRSLPEFKVARTTRGETSMRRRRPRIVRTLRMNFRGPNAGMGSSIRGPCKCGAFRGGRGGDGRHRDGRVTYTGVSPPRRRTRQRVAAWLERGSTVRRARSQSPVYGAEPGDR
jgi:hypothetical protein